MSEILTFNNLEVVMPTADRSKQSILMVNIPSLNYSIFGGWNWGTENNITRPGVIAILNGAKEAIIGNFIECFDEQGVEPYKALSYIDEALKLLLGVSQSSDMVMGFKKKGAFHNKKNDYTLLIESNVYRLHDDNKIRINPTIIWSEEKASSWKGRASYGWEDESDKSVRLSHTLELKSFELNDWIRFVDGRKTKDMIEDIISPYL